MKQTSEHPPPGPPSSKPGRGRRPYRAPELVEYGSIAARTLSTAAGSFVDVMAQLTMNPPCY